MPIVCTALVLAYVIFYGIGLGPIPYFIGSELFDVGPRPIAMALGSVFNWGGNFLVGMLFPTVESVIGPHTFLIFAGALLIMAQIVRYVMLDPIMTILITTRALMSHLCVQDTLTGD